MKTRLLRGVFLLALSAAGLAACAPMAPNSSLFERLGGTAGIATVVDRTLERSASDPRTRRSFAGIKLATIKTSLAQQLCALSGGGCVYEGETMARSHQDARIQASEFDVLVQILREELDRAGVSAGAKNELLRLLAPMKRDIVSHAAPTAAPGNTQDRPR
ncbi:group 1 truncated hemoglobin [Paucibacter sp. DJ1R-11]|uniref:group I truncated hemoglobin n=1 Tax=Paucibacter sp. DJ1R-11 TaxID=2893556 RepID=UPI0021E36777|nr:group 1 truncated hemoglobin [Paucibacter sp. DJ1R-11]MCV2362211.1 group 1 truncated hemoglobin [Paucibacter sp. DJ1R-11]